MELVTGKGASDHVSSADVASFNRGLLTADDVVLDTGDKLSCTMLDANTAEIGTGDFLLQGHHARVEIAEQLTIRSGSQGFNRNDLIVARYTLGTGNIQSAYLAVIEGTAVAGEASDPSYTSGDIDGGDVLVEFPLWRIPLTGITVGDPERIMPTIDTLQAQITSVRESVTYESLSVTSDSARVVISSAKKFGKVVFVSGSVTSGNGGFIDAQLSGLPNPPAAVAAAFTRITGTEPRDISALIDTAIKFRFYSPSNLPYDKGWSCTYIC